ncbi:MAG: hypothetical protein KVP17_000413 [Porospora cf. gigantea B]|uniref:uncharacterized protein n=1 Tax=Porospora cf. gigantea B TaxID=2853592 RepID=UPI003571BBD7|nr:MAG: hypothetical protein KVP17_000413 [Porospora cf. gigantea B]
MFLDFWCPVTNVKEDPREVTRHNMRRVLREMRSKYGPPLPWWRRVVSWFQEVRDLLDPKSEVDELTGPATIIFLIGGMALLFVLVHIGNSIQPAPEASAPIAAHIAAPRFVCPLDTRIMCPYTLNEVFSPLSWSAERQARVESVLTFDDLMDLDVDPQLLSKDQVRSVLRSIVPEYMMQDSVANNPPLDWRDLLDFISTPNSTTEWPTSTEWPNVDVANSEGRSKWMGWW